MRPDSSLEFSPFRLDLLNQQLWRDSEVVAVRPKPFAVLAYLAAHAGRLVPAAELRKAVWPDTYVGEGLLRGYIREVRAALGDDPEHPRFVETIPRRGYRFLPAVTTVPPVQGPRSKIQDQISESTPDPRPPTPFPPIPNPQSTMPMVGRDAELAQLRQWLATALNGTRQVVFVLGEPGIGKTTLIDAFLEGITNPKPQFPNPGPWVARGQCIEHYGGGEAYLPVLEALGQLCRQPGAEQVVTLLSRYAPTWLVQMPAVVGEAELETVQRRVQGATRERMLRELAEAMEVLTAERPLVLVLEDLHWSDPSTLDLLSLLAQRRGPARLMLLGTYRPADVSAGGHPLKAMKQELQARGQCRELPLGFLTAAEVARYLAARFPRRQFPPELGQVIYQRTEGNPLFLVNVVDYWVSQGVLVETDGQWELAGRVGDVAAKVPESVRQMIEKQLERLTPEEQRMLEAASVAGVEFSTAAVAVGLEEEAARVEEWGEGLAGREQFLRARGTETLADETVTGRYGFLHALYQQVLYEQVAVVRRVRLHRRIGEWGEGAYGNRVGEHAAELATHFERGQDCQRAVQYLWHAAENARRKHAYRETVALLRKSVDLLKTQPDTVERARQELALLVTLGVPLLMTKGYAAPEVEQTYARARQLCQEVGEGPQLLPALAGLFRFYFVRADFSAAQGFAEQTLRLAQQTSDSTVFLIAHCLLGALATSRGEFVTAREHFDKGLSLYDPQQHRFMALMYGDDPGVTCLSLRALGLWFSGYPDQALQSAQDGLALARALDLPYNLAFALDIATWIHFYRGEPQAAQACLDPLSPLAGEQGFQFFSAESAILQGWVMTEQGREAEGLAQMRPGVVAYRATGAVMSRPTHLGLLAKTYGKVGQIQEGRAALAEAFAVMDKTGEYCLEAEIYRLKGELLLAQEGKNQEPAPNPSTTLGINSVGGAKGKRQKLKNT